MPKESTVHSICFAALFPVLTNPYDQHRFMHTYPPIRYNLRRCQRYSYPVSFPYNFIYLSLHRCGSTEHPLLASLGAPDPPKCRPCLTYIEPARIRQGQLEEKDVAHLPYSNETWTTEFMGSATEREKRMRGKCMQFEVVLYAYRYLRCDDGAIGRVGLTFALDSTTYSKRHPSLRSPIFPSSASYSQPEPVPWLVQVGIHRRFPTPSSLRIPSPPSPLTTT